MIFEINIDGKYRHSDSLVFKETDGEITIIPEHSGVAVEEDALLTLSGTGALIWSLLDGTHTVQQIIEQVVDHYDAPQEQVRMDTVAFLQELAVRKMIAA